MHDESRILVGVLVESVELRNCIVKCLLRKLASGFRVVKDLIVEYGKVQSETQADRVCGGELRHSNVGGLLVCVKGHLSGILAIGIIGEFGEVAVVVALHLEVEDLGLAGVCGRNEVFVKQVENVPTNTAELLFNGLSVLLIDCRVSVVTIVLFLVFNGRDDSPGGASRTNDILKRNRQKVPFLDAEFRGGLRGFHGDLAHLSNHFCMANTHQQKS